MYVCVYIYRYAHIHICTYTYTYLVIYVYIHMHNTLNSKQLAVRSYPVWGGLFICFARYMHMGYRIFGHFPVFLLGSQEVQQRNNQTPGYIPSITGRSYCGNNGIATTRCNVQNPMPWNHPHFFQVLPFEGHCMTIPPRMSSLWFISPYLVGCISIFPNIL